MYGEPKRMQPMSRQLADKAITLLGHVIRSRIKDRSRRVGIDAEFKRVERSKRRVGRPRFFWLQSAVHDQSIQIRMPHMACPNANPTCTTGCTAKPWRALRWEGNIPSTKNAKNKTCLSTETRTRRRNKGVRRRGRDHTRASKRRNAGETNRIAKNRRAGNAATWKNGAKAAEHSIMEDSIGTVTKMTKRRSCRKAQLRQKEGGLS